MAPAHFHPVGPPATRVPVSASRTVTVSPSRRARTTRRVSGSYTTAPASAGPIAAAHRSGNTGVGGPAGSASGSTWGVAW